MTLRCQAEIFSFAKDQIHFPVNITWITPLISNITITFDCKILMSVKGQEINEIYVYSKNIIIENFLKLKDTL